MTTAPRDIVEAVETLGELSLPFELVMIWPVDERMVLSVASNEVESVAAYFHGHPIILADGTTVPFDIHGGVGSWISEPSGGQADTPDPMPLEDLIGLELREAARRANQSGWLVRAYEPEAPLTADHRPNRLNLCYSTNDIVTDAHVG